MAGFAVRYKGKLKSEIANLAFLEWGEDATREQVDRVFRSHGIKEGCNHSMYYVAKKLYKEGKLKHQQHRTILKNSPTILPNRRNEEAKPHVNGNGKVTLDDCRKLKELCKGEPLNLTALKSVISLVDEVGLKTVKEAISTIDELQMK